MVGINEIEEFCKKISGSSKDTSAEFKGGVCYMITKYDVPSPSSGANDTVKFNVVVTPGEIRLKRQLITDEFDISLSDKYEGEAGDLLHPERKKGMAQRPFYEFAYKIVEPKDEEDRERQAEYEGEYHESPLKTCGLGGLGDGEGV